MQPRYKDSSVSEPKIVGVIPLGLKDGNPKQFATLRKHVIVRKKRYKVLQVCQNQATPQEVMVPQLPLLGLLENTGLESLGCGPKTF